jgi:putative ABC transport system permease protein
MRTHKFDGWLLARLAAQTLSRRRLRVFLLALSVAMAVGVGLASLVLGWSIRDGISTDFSRMGADMIVVPRDTLVNITSSLLTVQPTDESMEAALTGKLAKIPGVERVAPQRLVSAMVEGQQYKLIAFDPRVDLGSWRQPWERRAGSDRSPGWQQSCGTDWRNLVGLRPADANLWTSVQDGCRTV